MNKVSRAHSSAARTTTGQTSSVPVLGPNVAVALNVTAVSGTTPSMTVSLEWSNDETTWHQADSADSMTAVTATGAKVKLFTAKAKYCRAVYTISGTTPSFTFTVDIYCPE